MKAKLFLSTIISGILMSAAFANAGKRVAKRKTVHQQLTEAQKALKKHGLVRQTLDCNKAQLRALKSGQDFEKILEESIRNYQEKIRHETDFLTDAGKMLSGTKTSTDLVKTQQECFESINTFEVEEDSYQEDIRLQKKYIDLLSQRLEVERERMKATEEQIKAEKLFLKAKEEAIQ